MRTARVIVAGMAGAVAIAGAGFGSSTVALAQGHEPLDTNADALRQRTRSRRGLPSLMRSEVSDARSDLARDVARPLATHGRLIFVFVGVRVRTA